MAMIYAPPPPAVTSKNGKAVDPGLKKTAATTDTTFAPVSGMQSNPVGDAASSAVNALLTPSVQHAADTVESRLAPPAPAPTPTAPHPYNPAAGWDVAKLNDPTQGTSEKYLFGRAAQDFTGWSRGNLQPLVDYYNRTHGKNARVVSGDEVDFGDGFGPIDVINGNTNGLQWVVGGGAPGGQGAAAPTSPTSGGVSGGGTPGAGPATGPGAGMPGTPGYAAGGPGGASGALSMAGGVFSDPATSQWEQLLRSVVDRMGQAQPTWTPSQLELQQTQALDPMEREHQAQRQRAVEWGAAHGQQPQSGPVMQALADIDRQFSQQRTTTQANFATQAIGREDQLFNANEQRAMNATNIMKQIPQLADSRLALANSTLIPSNPAQLLAVEQRYDQSALNQQNVEQQQNQQFYANITNAILQMLLS